MIKSTVDISKNVMKSSHMFNPRIATIQSRIIIRRTSISTKFTRSSSRSRSRLALRHAYFIKNLSSIFVLRKK